MRTLNLICLFLVQTLYSQSDFIKVEHNKVLSVLSFKDTAAQGFGSSPSYVELIQETYGMDEDFQLLVQAYQTINFMDVIERERFPKKRPSHTSVQDLLWIASASSSTLDDFSVRSFGVLTPDQHKTLIDVLRAATPYYDTLVWNPTSRDRVTMEQSMAGYTSRVTEIFQKVRQFLGSTWDENVPFRIMLYPIPKETGATSAIPKGNNLICSYLSKRQGEDKDVIGIAVHEMNHILYSAQPLELQESINEWFTSSNNPVAAIAYNFFDEGLATAVGNGWAYEQLNGILDLGEWYNV